jgi:hypothetical protein
MMRSRLWHRIRRGYYTFSDIWQTLDPVDRHLVSCRCVLDSLGPGTALSHVSGALAHGLDVWNVPLDRVHVTRPDGRSGRTEAGVVHHEGTMVSHDLVEVAGMPVLTPVRCALETGTLTNGEGALVVLDNLLNRELADPDQLFQQFEEMAAWPSTRHLHIPVRMAHAKSESAGESRGRWLFWIFGLPAPRCQHEVFDENGILAGTCDWAWPENHQLGEFDGQVKYGRLLKPGQDPGDVVFAEKQREDRLREITGWSMVRITWGDFQRPRVTAERVRHLLNRAA